MMEKQKIKNFRPLKVIADALMALPGKLRQEIIEAYLLVGIIGTRCQDASKGIDVTLSMKGGGHMETKFFDLDRYSIVAGSSLDQARPIDMRSILGISIKNKDFIGVESILTC